MKNKIVFQRTVLLDQHKFLYVSRGVLIDHSPYCQHPFLLWSTFYICQKQTQRVQEALGFVRWSVYQGINLLLSSQIANPFIPHSCIHFHSSHLLTILERQELSKLLLKLAVVMGPEHPSEWKILVISMLWLIFAF